jgi:hypothetical protein
MREIKNLDALELSESLLDTYKCVHGFGFNGHFISLIPTKNYYYLAYKHRCFLQGQFPCLCKVVFAAPPTGNFTRCNLSSVNP